jgi:nucleotide-binding universal stress UspA family protein
MQTFERILCPIDFSDGSRAALTMAGAVARWYEGRLTVLHVHANWPVADMLPSLRPVEARPVPMDDEERGTVLRAVRAFTDQVGVPDGVPVDYLIEDSLDVVSAVLAHADSVDVVVLGTHGRTGVERLLLGSVAERVLRKAPCPVIVVPPRAHPPKETVGMGRRILCGVDFSDASLSALEYATSLAEEADATLTLIHVIEMPPDLKGGGRDEGEVRRTREAVEAECLQRLRALVPESVGEACTVHVEVTEGRAAQELVRAAREGQDDLLVMGVRGRNAMDLAVFGSNTNQVVRTAPCPVMVVHSSVHPAAH